MSAWQSFLRGALGTFTGGEPIGPLPSGMLEGITPGAIGEPPTRGMREQLQAYSQAPWVRAIVGRIADSVASAEWKLYVIGRPDERARRVPQIASARGVTRTKLLQQARDAGELREITSHLFLDTWSIGNSFLTGHATRKVTQIHLETAGEAYALKERNGAGATIGLWPIPPDWILSTPTPSRPFFRVSHRAWQATIPDTEVLWHTDPNPSNPYGRGTGQVRALADEIETDEYAARTLKQWFFNNARPDLVVMPAKESQDALSEADARRAELRWTQKLGGFWNRWKPMFLSRYVEIQEFDKDFRKQQLIQIREHARDICLQTWGVPPEILGVIENANRATIDAAQYLYNSNVIVPRLEFLRASMQERLLPEYDPRLILQYVSPVAEDESMLLEVAKASPWARMLDEWRVAQGLEPLPGGKGQVFVMPGTVFTVKDPMDAEKAEPPPQLAVDPNAPKPPAPKKPADDAELDEDESRALKRLAAFWRD